MDDEKIVKMILLKKYKAHFVKELSGIYDSMEIDSFFYLITDSLYHKRRIDLAMLPDFCIKEEELITWNEILKQLKEEKPIQYILGTTDFFGLTFKVSTDTLIPRPETEELVDWVLSVVKEFNEKELHFLDIGTGTGCIPISFKKNAPHFFTYGLDVSLKALEKAKENALLNKVEVEFIHQDILQTLTLEKEYDIIVSNPPYVRILEKSQMKKNVLAYEPHLALFVEDSDALLFYRKIALLAQKGLKPRGYLFFEINQYLGKETVALLEEIGFKKIELKKDIYGNDRMIKASL